MEYDDIYGFDTYSSKNDFAEYAGMPGAVSPSIEEFNPLSERARKHYLDDPYVKIDSKYKFDA